MPPQSAWPHWPVGRCSPTPSTRRSRASSGRHASLSWPSTHTQAEIRDLVTAGPWRKPIQVVLGGSERQHSVASGVAATDDDMRCCRGPRRGSAAGGGRRIRPVRRGRSRGRCGDPGRAGRRHDQAGSGRQNHRHRAARRAVVGANAAGVPAGDPPERARVGDRAEACVHGRSRPLRGPWAWHVRIVPNEQPNLKITRPGRSRPRRGAA